jgi:excisionase family DNA binding protein
MDDQHDSGQYVQQLPALLLRPEQAAQVLAIGERTLWERTKAGEIPVVRIGRSVRYRLPDLEGYVSKLTAGNPGED